MIEYELFHKLYLSLEKHLTSQLQIIVSFFQQLLGLLLRCSQPYQLGQLIIITHRTIILVVFELLLDGFLDLAF